MNLTPMMRQYFEIKEAHQDCILFFRLGDFYEMFFEDAKTASRELEITLTGRDCGQEEKAPMCGVPFHSAENYIARLVEKGYKVAICEQVEDPKATKGIVKREVVRIITPGTILEGNTIEEGKNNYLAAAIAYESTIGLSLCDVTTGEWLVTEMEADHSKLLDELTKFSPRECLLDSSLSVLKETLINRFNSCIETIPDHLLDVVLAEKNLLGHFKVLGLDGLGLAGHIAGVLAASNILTYLKETQKNDLSHLSRLSYYNIHSFMLLDASTRRNLELTETLREKKRRGSLLWVLDYTKTAMGARYLRKCIEQPLIHASIINKRLDATRELKDNLFMRDDLMNSLNEIYDIERLVGKISYGTCNAKELIALKQSLKILPTLYNVLSESLSIALKEMYETFDTLEDLYERIDVAIIDDPPISLREGGLIKEGFNAEVDELRSIKLHGTNWLRDIETREREKTGIKNLKIKYNKVFGYFLEVTQSYSHLVPDYFIRKQTLSNCERYITEELKTIEDKILGADEKLQVLEYNLFTDTRDEIARHMDRLLRTSHQLAKLDVFTSLAQAAEVNNFVAPIMDDGDSIHIVGGRHPVVEKIIGHHQFIANDVKLDHKEDQIHLITGPNMAGKSTYMRQVALIVLMAQIGSFVPAESAHIGVVDRIFTRVGASDDLASGQSTFMVEMMEVSNILNHATSKSLLILDEIGRGTSTIDGLSIAWAIIEHIADSNKLGAKTLFATHYHELTELEKNIPVLRNYCVQVKEMGDTIIFLHKIIRGSVDHSYGIQVAKLAGLPEEVLTRAHAIMGSIDHDVSRDLRDKVMQNSEVAQVSEEPVFKVSTPIAPTPSQKSAKQLQLFSSDSEEEVIKQLKTIDIMSMTPLDAMQCLYELKKKIQN